MLSAASAKHAPHDVGGVVVGAEVVGVAGGIVGVPLCSGGSGGASAADTDPSVVDETGRVDHDPVCHGAALPMEDALGGLELIAEAHRLDSVVDKLELSGVDAPLVACAAAFLDGVGAGREADDDAIDRADVDSFG